MNLLITLCLTVGYIMPLLEFSAELLSPQEKEIIGFITEYYNKYKKIPTLERVSKEFAYFLPTTISSTSEFVLEDVVDQVKQAKLAHKWEYTLENIKATVHETGDLPVGELAELLKLTSITSGVSSYTSFDREEYFRRPGLPTGLKLIDLATGGISNGEVMVIAGRLGNKKTTLSLFVANSWWKAGKKILFSSMEMVASDIYSRLDGIVGRFNPMIVRGERTKDVDAKIENAFGMVKYISKEHNGEIFIPRRKMKTPAEVFALAQFLGVDGIIIDGLYLMQPNGGHFGSKWERISEISNQLKEGAGDTLIPTIAITQIKRVGGRKEMFDPEDLAYSDSIGQDADFVLVTNPTLIDKDKLEVQLIKNRFGKEISTLCSIDFDKMTLTEESVLEMPTSGEDFFTSSKSGSGEVTEI